MDDDLIYHYTDQAGLVGILKTKKLWASNILYLNDSMEYKHTLHLLSGELVMAELDVDFSKKYVSFLNCLQKILERAENGFRADSVFVASFSGSRDQLSQWRGYGQNGYAIGFSKEDIKNLSLKQEFELIPCTYDINAQCEEISSLVRTAINDYHDQSEDISIKDIKNLLQGKSVSSPLTKIIRRFWSSVSRLAPSFKHESFQEEHEIRIFKKIKRSTETLESSIQFRQGTGLLIPYVVFDLELGSYSAIKEIIAGPSPHIDLKKRSMTLFSKQCGLKEVTFSASESPFRNWG